MTVYNYSFETNHPLDMINLDSFIESSLDKSKIKEGIMLVYCPHTTAAITVNENSDPHVRHDLMYAFNLLSPKRNTYLHLEGNSHAHLLSTMVGVSKEFIIRDGRPILGLWQSIYFCEFDGPRHRKVHIKFIEG